MSDKKKYMIPPKSGGVKRVPTQTIIRPPLLVRKMPRFKKPTDEQLIKFVILVNNGKLQPRKLADMLAVCNLVIDRLYENGDVMIPSSKENSNPHGKD